MILTYRRLILQSQNCINCYLSQQGEKSTIAQPQVTFDTTANIEELRTQLNISFEDGAKQQSRINPPKPGPTEPKSSPSSVPTCASFLLIKYHMHLFSLPMGTFLENLQTEVIVCATEKLLKASRF